MIKTTKIKSQGANTVTLVFIPGGPGLSSLTLRSMDILSRSYNLCYVDFPGCNGNPYQGKKSFEELSKNLGDELNKLEGEIFLVGHSFGGFFAAQVALSNKYAGIICLSAPFSVNTLNSLTANYKKFKTEELTNAELRWSKESNDSTFSRWLAEYGVLYFKKENIDKGKKLILEDKVSAQFFIDNRSVGNKMESLLEKLKSSKFKKLLLAGSNDELVSKECLEQDALAGGFEFSLVNNSGHFTTFDQPETVASLIESFIATDKGKL